MSDPSLLRVSWYGVNFLVALECCFTTFLGQDTLQGHQAAGPSGHLPFKWSYVGGTACLRMFYTSEILCSILMSMSQKVRFAPIRGRLLDMDLQ